MGERFASWFAVLMLMAVLGASYWYAQTLNGAGGGDSGRIGAVDFFAEQVALTGFDAQGRGHYRLFADRMTHYARSDDVDLARPRLLSMRTDEPLVQATAQSALVHNNGESVLMSGDVVLTRAADAEHPAMRLDTDQLLALPDDDRFSTAAPVHLHAGSAVLDAVGMDFDNVARRVELRTQVSGVFPPRSRP
jgi:lipopolysaccharide export system protein LptC